MSSVSFSESSIELLESLQGIRNELSVIMDPPNDNPMTIDELMDTPENSDNENNPSTQIPILILDTPDNSDNEDNRPSQLPTVSFHIEDNSSTESDDETEDVQMYIDRTPSNVTVERGQPIMRKRNRGPNEPRIGIYAFAESFGRQGREYNENGNTDLAMKYYKMALEIDDYHSCSQEIAVIYETVLEYTKALGYYEKSINNNNDVVAMYNLADMYYNCEMRYHMNHDYAKDMVNKHTSFNEFQSKKYMYWSMAADMGDNESLELLCAMSYKKEPVHFARSFKTILDNKLDHYNWDPNAEPEEDGRPTYSSFVKDNNSLTVLDELKSVDTNEMNQEDKDTINQCIVKIEQDTCVTTYRNKVALFTRLNNVTECGICYDEKLNINLHCGHCVCTDCYKRLLTSDCPFCRTPSPYELFSD
jgi:tetratricopeptide (TPR) repeat protein